MTPSDLTEWFLQLKAQDKTLDGIDGSRQGVFFDLTVRPNVVFASAVMSKIADFRMSSSLSNAERMTPEQLDRAVSNFLIERSGPQKVYAEMEIWLNPSDTPLSIRTTDKFAGPDGISFSTNRDYVFLPSTLEKSGNYHVARFSVVSENATRKVLASEIVGTLTHPAIVRVFNPLDSSEYVVAQTNEQFLAVVKSALSSRTLTTGPGTVVTLNTEFPNIRDIMPIGHGDPEMRRDISIAGRAFSWHSGGMSDIYIRTAMKTMTHQCVGYRIGSSTTYELRLKRYKGYDAEGKDASMPSPFTLGTWTKIDGTLPELPVLYATSISGPDFSMADVEVDDKTFFPKIRVKPTDSKRDLRLSVYEDVIVYVKLTKDVGFSNTFNLTYVTMDGLEDIQEFIARRQSEGLFVSILAKSFVPVEVVSMLVSYDKSYAVDEADARAKIAFMINSWTRPEPIRLSELVRILNAPIRLAEVGRGFDHGNQLTQDQTYPIPPSKINYDGPTYAEFIQHDIDGTDKRTYSTHQIFARANAELGCSSRTVRYFIDPTKIEFVGV